MCWRPLSTIWYRMQKIKIRKGAWWGLTGAVTSKMAHIWASVLFPGIERQLKYQKTRSFLKPQYCFPYEEMWPFSGPRNCFPSEECNQIVIKYSPFRGHNIFFVKGVKTNGEKMVKISDPCRRHFESEKSVIFSSQTSVSAYSPIWCHNPECHRLKKSFPWKPNNL